MSAGPLVAGVGVDAVDVERFRRVLQRRPGVAERVFTDAERADCARGGDAAERLAARFAAKEAVLKALGRGIGAVPLRELEVTRHPGPGPGRGAPSLRLGPAAAALSAERRVAHWHLSLTHTASVAMAIVVAEATPAVTVVAEAIPEATVVAEATPRG
jgi:holo-[acyl-carrier protein] synthase